MSRRFPPPPPAEPADSRSCDAGGCDAPSIGYRWFPVWGTGPEGGWLASCPRHIVTKGVPPEFRHYDPGQQP